MSSKCLSLPLSRADACSLVAGDACLLTGVMYVLRDAGHALLLKEIDAHEGRLPYNLSGEAIFYAGPTPERDDSPFGAIGPTTASRMDFAAPRLYDCGIRATIGKGLRSEAVCDACVRNKAVYFVTVGGAAAYLAQCIISAQVVAYDHLGCEALRRIHVQNFPVFVGIDTCGRDIYSYNGKDAE